jgi:dephospho-CoA kinase
VRRDARERGWGLEEVIRAADVRIVNEGSLQDFYENVRRALRKIDG